MKPYINLNGKSNIDAYEIGIDFLKVAFANGTIYTFTEGSVGPDYLKEMKELAESGSGLNGFINKYAKEDYADIE